MNLDIHLDRCDTLMSTGYLEVHIAEEIFQTLDIGQNQIIVVGISGHQTAGNTCNRLLDRYAGSHQRHCGRTDTCLRSRTIGFKSLRYSTDRIRELFLCRKYRDQRTLCQRSMSDFTASRSAGRLCLSYGIRRKIVLVHISLRNLKLIQSIQLLRFGKRSQCSNVADLGLSAGKHCRTVNSRNDIDLCRQRTDLVDRTSIRTFVVFQDHLADSLLLVLVNRLSKHCQPLFVVCECFLQFFCDHADIFLTCLFVIGKYRLFHLFLRNNLADCGKQFFRHRAAFIGVFRLSACCNDLINKFDDLLVYIMCLIDCLDHLCFRNLVGARFDHDYFLTGGCNGQVYIGNCFLCQCRVDDQLAVDHTDLGHCTRTVKRNIGNAGCDRGTQHRNNLRVAVRIYGHYHIVQGNVVAVILREQRTHRAVDDTAGQDRMLTCLSLSFIESARDLSYGIHFLFVFYTQREEINPVSRFVGRCSGRQDYRVAIMHKSRAVGLFCHTVYINCQGSSCQFHGKTLVHKTALLFIFLSGV